MAAPVRPKVTGQAQQKVTQVKPRTVKVKAHTRTVTPRAPAFNPNAQPITPGSGITVGQAARMAGNAVTTRYGPQTSQLNTNVARNTQLGHDQAGWYDAYLRELQQHRDNIAQSEAQSSTAVAGLANSLRSVDQSTLSQTQAANKADAANRGATVGQQVSTNADNASLVRQALMGSFGAELANRGKNATDYADTLAHVVGPGQKLQAQAGNARTGQELLKQLADLKGQSGAYKQQFLDSLTQSEAKNVLAASIAQGKDLTALTRVKETVRHDKASEANTATGQKITAANNAGKVNAYGYTTKEWSAMTPAQRQQTMAKVKNQQRAPKAVKTKSGFLAPAGEARVVNEIHQIISFIQSAPKVDSKGVKLTDHELRVRLMSGNNPTKKAVDNRIINIAFDVLRRGGLSAPNVRAAHDLGIHARGHFKILGAPSGAIKAADQGVFKI